MALAAAPVEPAAAAAGDWIDVAWLRRGEFRRLPGLETPLLRLGALDLALHQHGRRQEVLVAA